MNGRKRFPAGAGYFCLRRHAQNVTVAQYAPVKCLTGSPYPGTKQQEHQADHSRPSST